MPVGECGSAFGSAISNIRRLHLWSCHFHPDVLKATISSCHLLECFSGDRCGWFPSRRPDLSPLMEALLERSTDTLRYSTLRRSSARICDRMLSMFTVLKRLDINISSVYAKNSPYPPLSIFLQTTVTHFRLRHVCWDIFETFDSEDGPLAEPTREATPALPEFISLQLATFGGRGRRVYLSEGFEERVLDIQYLCWETENNEWMTSGGQVHDTYMTRRRARGSF